MTQGRFTRRALLASTATGLLAVRSEGQTGDSSLSGMVTYRDGQPASAVLYIGRQGKYRQTTCKLKAGKNVGYTLLGMLPGRHEIMVTAPGAKPKRLWGLQMMNAQQRQLNIVLDRANTAAEELYYSEEGDPIREDMPREWNGGWLEGIIVNSKGDPVEGTLKFYRAGTVFAEIPAGSPLLPAYFETRALTPGSCEVRFVPSGSATLKPVIVERMVVDQNARTRYGALVIPAGAATDNPVMLPAPEKKAAPVPEVAPRRRGIRH